MRQNREAKDAQRIARAVLSCPLNEGPAINPEDAVSVEALKEANLDLFTRAVLAHGLKAANGDAKSMEIIMKLAGYEMKQDLNVTLTIPTYIDDVTMVNVTPAIEPSITDEVPLIEAPSEPTIIALEPPTVKCVENGMEFATMAEAARFADVSYNKFRTALVKGKDIDGMHYVRIE